MKKKILALVLPFLFLLSTFNYSVTVYANATNDSIPKNSASSTLFRFDGKVTSGEWNENHTIAFPLDVENIDGDVDGENYLYLGQDNVSLFLAFDFASDNTSDDTGEWFGVWLNVANRSFGDNQDWHDYINNGTECVIWDTEFSKEWEFFKGPPLEEVDIIGFTSDSEYTVQDGFPNGDYTAFDKYDDGNDFNITAENGGDYVVGIDFSINVSDFYSIFNDLYMDELISINDIEYWFTLNDTIDEHKIILWDSEGNYPGLNNLTQSRDVSNVVGGPWQVGTSKLDIANMTNGKIIKFTLFANHTSSFNLSIHRLKLNIRRTKTNYPTGAVGESWLQHPYTSLNAYAIGKSFGSSPTNATSHRMYEMIIPLSELEGYNKTTHHLGITLGGYGTAAFPGQDYWAWPTSSPPINNPYPLEDSTLYHYVRVNETTLHITYGIFGDDDDDDDDDVTIIPFGNYYLFFAVLGVMALVIIQWKRKSKMKIT
jgi:hypothetical protein